MNVKDAGDSNKGSLDVMAANVKQAGMDISSNVATAATYIDTLATNVATAGTENKGSLDALAGIKLHTYQHFCICCHFNYLFSLRKSGDSSN